MSDPQDKFLNLDLAMEVVNHLPDPVVTALRAAATTAISHS